jgi:hypothetical protein
LSQPAPAPTTQQAVASYDARPFFARALDYGLKNGHIDSEKLETLRNEGAKGIVQIADYFGTAHLRTDLDEALKRMVYLASLYLEHTSDGRLPRAARSLQENSFLSHSRGGSQMLKTLFAMPTDSTIPEPAEPDDVREFLRTRTLADQWSVAEYRARHAERHAFLQEIEAALWFAEVMEIPRDALYGESAESVLDACLLTRIAGRYEGALLTGDELKTFFKSLRRAKKKPTMSGEMQEVLLEDVPENHRDAAARHLKRILSKDLARIADTKVPFNDLVREYHDRFHHFSLSSDVSDYDALVTDEWKKVTKGKTDSDSMNTVFLCLAAGKPPKPTITAAEAKAAIRAIRTDGAAVATVPEFIRRSAPHEMIDGLISLWEDEFYPEMIEQLILENADGPLDPVVRLLSEHCHITAPAKKR